MNELDQFGGIISKSIDETTFLKVTLSKSKDNDGDLENVYVRQVTLKEKQYFSFTYHHTKKDQVRNLEIEKGIKTIKKLLDETFKNGTIFTTIADHLLQTSKKGKVTLKKLKPSQVKDNSGAHDRKKIKRVSIQEKYLQLLGITDEKGTVIPRMADKYRQINKYLEIIEGLVESAQLAEHIHIVDMGSGKGYLTFSLYNYLKNRLNLNVSVIGIELRQDLVDFCNETAKAVGFSDLNFICQSIEAFEQEKVDILIALHACDTATDDAIAKGIEADASLIICAPCCHKQIRQQLKGKKQTNPLLKYGIFKERQYEMVTDTIRALILEKHQYRSNIFEFVSNEHTRKNIMLVGTKNSQASVENASQKIKEIKEEFGIEQHYLESLIK